jgi:membrane-bound lytic murein transglycosylase D
MASAGVADDEPEDLWEKIRQGFEFPDRNHPQTLRYARRYASRPYHLKTVLQRAEAYLYLVVEEIERRDMPTELALLPMVESAYHPFAYSPSHAAGLWQFIPSTAEIYGLKRTSRYDGRRDVVASTRAALDYLQKLYADFDGDWLHALAAYNCGEGCVQRAIAANRRRGKPTDFWSLRLPSQARAYVPSLLGIAALVESPTRFSAPLAPIPNDPYLAQVEAGRPIRLAEVAKMCGLSLEEVHRFNPGYHRGVTDPSGLHRLLLPVDRVEIFKQRLARLDRNSKPNSRVASERPLPVASAHRASHTFQVARAPTGPSRLEGHANTQAAGFHVVAHNETLWGISARYQTSVQQLRRWNQLGPRDRLKVGQRLVVRPGATRVARVEPAHSRGAFSPVDNHHAVLTDEPLWKIAQRFRACIDEPCSGHLLPTVYPLEAGTSPAAPARPLVRHNRTGHSMASPRSAQEDSTT